ncbi:hypothetical protein WICPIJ_007399 [Wickerhamomyces pijperi]|uniref:Uncharacterized protein n=1 Tax=Wickerhamomyces pijperi TaxID=599730 RepID=A0A9P8Q2I0_WICPI|nr:hypothetical protein WICPIJ_007399 [Wickerhamomyces pijperi]
MEGSGLSNNLEISILSEAVDSLVSCSVDCSWKDSSISKSCSRCRKAIGAGLTQHTFPYFQYSITDSAMKAHVAILNFLNSLKSVLIQLISDMVLSQCVLLFEDLNGSAESVELDGIDGIENGVLVRHWKNWKKQLSLMIVSVIKDVIGVLSTRGFPDCTTGCDSEGCDCGLDDCMGCVGGNCVRAGVGVRSETVLFTLLGVCFTEASSERDERESPIRVGFEPRSVTATFLVEASTPTSLFNISISNLIPLSKSHLSRNPSKSLFTLLTCSSELIDLSFLSVVTV